MLKHTILLILSVSLSLNSIAQKPNITGNWTLNASLSEFNGNPKYIADSTLQIEQRGDTINFERTFYNPHEIVIENTILNRKVSVLRDDHTTKSIEITYSQSEHAYVMTCNYSKPGQPDMLDYTFIHKWSIDTNGRLIRWIISVNDYTVKLVYDRV